MKIEKFGKKFQTRKAHEKIFFFIKKINLAEQHTTSHIESHEKIDLLYM